MSIKDNIPFFLDIRNDELPAYVIELIITSHELAKQLDIIRFNYEKTIGKISLECFQLFLELNRLDKIVTENEKSNKLFSKKTYQSGSSEEFNRQLMEKLQVIKTNHQEVINNFVCQSLNLNELTVLRESYRYIISRVNPDLNLTISWELLELWHQAENYFYENNLDGLKTIENQISDIKPIYENIIDEKQKTEYYAHLREYARNLEDEIALFSNPSYHPFWIDMLNEEQTISDINNHIKLFRTMITELNNKINSISQLNPRLT
ncbi:MAG: hypothetical protein PHG08_07150 [Bacilli bacterium]|jgi:hypothetical protein|nr:hypothetical protein [Bacilli bacterium]HHU24833.1 hypothetical protein [Acholeplasmataceae bacterium]